MSSALQFPVTDAFLLKYGAVLPENNKIEIDPNYGNVELITPYCRLAFVYFDPPKVGKPFKAPDGSIVPGKTTMQATMMFNPAGIDQIYDALLAIVDNNFNAEERIGPNGEKVVWKPADLLYAPSNMQGALKNPLKNGTETWQNSAKPELYEVQKGLFTLQASMSVADGKGNPQSPIFLDAQGDPCSPKTFYAGCYARAVLRLSPYPRRGQQGFGARGVAAQLQTVQFVAPGQKLGGFDRLVHSQERLTGAGAIVIDPAFTAPINRPVATIAAFAAAPQQPNGNDNGGHAPQQQPQIERPIAPHLPQGYVPAGARPPGR